MAVFEYGVRYKGKVMSEGLGKALVGDLDRAIEQGKIELDVYRENPNFVATYRFWEEQKGVLVLMGVSSMPGKLKGTETVKFQFNGQEEHILGVKSGLLQVLDGLELS